LKTINVCPCQEGCQSCVGPAQETGRLAKQHNRSPDSLTLARIQRMHLPAIGPVQGLGAPASARESGRAP
jgi:hypothetical protein